MSKEDHKKYFAFYLRALIESVERDQDRERRGTKGRTKQQGFFRPHLVLSGALGLHLAPGGLFAGDPTISANPRGG